MQPAQEKAALADGQGKGGARGTAAWLSKPLMAQAMIRSQESKEEQAPTESGEQMATSEARRSEDSRAEWGAGPAGRWEN